MNAFKKKTLSIAIIAGLGLGFISNAHAQKIKVSEMTQFERIKRIVLLPSIICVPILVGSGLGQGLFDILDMPLRAGFLLGLAGGFSASLGLVKICYDEDIEIDVPFSLSESLVGVPLGMGLLGISIVAMLGANHKLRSILK